MSTRAIRSAILLSLAVAAVFVARPALAAADTADTAQSVVPRDTASGTVIVTYFHGDRRCATCKKLEAYSHEAVAEGFAERLADSSLLWRTVNYDRDENKHYIEDYGLYTKALIVARVVEGREVEWRNLDRIWNLVGNRDDFIAYVRNELKTFLEGPGEPGG